VKELIEQIGGRERLEALSAGHYCSVFECRNMASALLAVLDAPDNIVPGDVRRMDWLCSHAVHVMTPGPSGSRKQFFWAHCDSYVDEPYHNSLRKQIDAAMAAQAPGDKK
jgi:hypothetical protein